jgi:hypothetical protein
VYEKWSSSGHSQDQLLVRYSQKLALKKSLKILVSKSGRIGDFEASISDKSDKTDKSLECANLFSVNEIWSKFLLDSLGFLFIFVLVEKGRIARNQLFCHLTKKSPPIIFSKLP